MLTIESFSKTRITKVTNKGTYIFNVAVLEDSYVAELLYYQNSPADEATEQQWIKQVEFSNIEDATKQILSFYAEEEAREFAGYDLKTKRTTLRDILDREFL